MKYYNFCRLLLTFVDNALVWMFNKRARWGPLFVSWDITDTCNAKCIMCDRWKWDTQQKPISSVTKIRIVKDLGESGVRLLSLCGGEPFLEPGLREIVLAAKKYGMMINITTNGSLISEHLDIVGLLDSLIISVDSYIASVHEGIRGIPGLFSKINDGLEKIKKFEKRPTMSVRCLITPENIRIIGEYIDFWKHKVDRVLLQPIEHRPEIGYRVPCGMSTAPIGNAEVERFQHILRRHGMFNAYNKEIAAFISGKQGLKEKYHCFCGYFFLEIDSECVLWNCGDHRYSLGDLKERTLLELMNANRQRIRHFRQERDCICWYNCSMLNAYLTKILGRR